MRNFRIILITTLIFVFLAVGLVYVSPPLYRATIEILIERGLVYNMLRKDAKAYEEYIAYQKDLILSPAILQKTIKDLHLDISDRFAGKDPEKEFLKYIRVEIFGDTLIRISAYTDEGILSIRMAQALAKNYIDSIDKERYRIADDVKRWFLESSSLAKEILRKENELKKLGVTEGVVSIKGSLQTVKTVINTLKERRDELNNKIIKLQAVQERAKVYEGKSLEYILNVVDWPELKSLKEEYEKKKLEIAELTSVYTEEHPDIVKLKEEQKQILDKVQDIIDSYIGGEAEINLIKGQIISVDKELKDQNQKYEELLELAEKFSLQKKELSMLKENFDEVKARLEQQGFYPISVSVIGLTPEEIVPVAEYRSYTMPLIAAVCLGIFVGILLIIFLKPKMKKEAEEQP